MYFHCNCLLALQINWLYFFRLFIHHHDFNASWKFHYRFRWARSEKNLLRNNHTSATTDNVTNFISIACIFVNITFFLYYNFSEALKIFIFWEKLRIFNVKFILYRSTISSIPGGAWLRFWRQFSEIWWFCNIFGKK